MHAKIENDKKQRKLEEIDAMKAILQQQMEYARLKKDIQV
jgi:hypothetical protein